MTQDVSENARPLVPSTRARHRRYIVIILMLTVAFSGVCLWNFRSPMATAEIFRGVTYRCDKLRQGPETGGLAHVVTIDLRIPGIALYVTPVDSELASSGMQYRLESTHAVVNRLGLAVAMNGSYFAAPAKMFRRTGDLAVSTETVVSEHVVNQISPTSYLFWFEDDLTPHVEKSKPPSPAVLAKARFAVGSQLPLLHDGAIDPGAGHSPGRNTVIAFDGPRKLLMLCCFERVSTYEAGRYLLNLGATGAAVLDGGSSTAMVLGSGVKGVRGGALIGDWRAQATHIGVYAERLP